MTAAANSLAGHRIRLAAAQPGPAHGAREVAERAGGWCPLACGRHGTCPPPWSPHRGTEAARGHPAGPGTGRQTQGPGLQEEALHAKARGQPSSHAIPTGPGKRGASAGPGTRQPPASPQPERFERSDRANCKGNGNKVIINMGSICLGLCTVFKYFPRMLIHLILATTREVDIVIITIVFQTRRRVWTPGGAGEPAWRDNGAQGPPELPHPPLHPTRGEAHHPPAATRHALLKAESKHGWRCGRRRPELGPHTYTDSHNLFPFWLRPHLSGLESSPELPVCAPSRAQYARGRGRGRRTGRTRSLTVDPFSAPALCQAWLQALGGGRRARRKVPERQTVAQPLARGPQANKKAGPRK